MKAKIRDPEMELLGQIAEAKGEVATMRGALEHIIRACSKGIDQSDDELEEFIGNVRDIAKKALGKEAPVNDDLFACGHAGASPYSKVGWVVNDKGERICMDCARKAEEENDCPKCEGTGQISNAQGDYKDCPTCAGTGEIEERTSK